MPDESTLGAFLLWPMNRYGGAQGPVSNIEIECLIDLEVSSLVQSVATFFSHAMAAIGGNTAGPGPLLRPLLLQWAVVAVLVTVL